MLKYGVGAKRVMPCIGGVQERDQADDFTLYIELLRTSRVRHTALPSAFVKKSLKMAEVHVTI